MQSKHAWSLYPGGQFLECAQAVGFDHSNRHVVIATKCPVPSALVCRALFFTQKTQISSFCFQMGRDLRTHVQCHGVNTVNNWEAHVLCTRTTVTVLACIEAVHIQSGSGLVHRRPVWPLFWPKRHLSLAVWAPYSLFRRPDPLDWVSLPCSCAFRLLPEHSEWLPTKWGLLLCCDQWRHLH